MGGKGGREKKRKKKKKEREKRGKKGGVVQGCLRIRVMSNVPGKEA